MTNPEGELNHKKSGKQIPTRFLNELVARSTRTPPSIRHHVIASETSVTVDAMGFNSTEKHSEESVTNA
jgi:hypothetical protein